MSPIMSPDRSNWKVLTIKVREELYDHITEYAEYTKVPSLSIAVRELLSIALEAGGVHGIIDSTVRANAEAIALSRLSDALDDAIIEFRKSMQ